jgi:hypothetical protein
MRLYLLALVLVLSTNVAHGQAPTVLGGLGAGAKVANSPNALMAGNYSGGTLQESALPCFTAQTQGRS